ncbi:MAG: hypothetical protein JW731_00690 [Bacteroidales bacterium]|nr:hypothetical protein [Bacteroidales bacterium]
MIFTYILAWFVLMVIGILNGVLRVGTYGKLMPEIRAHQVSCFTGILFIGVAVYFMDEFWPMESANQALLIGTIWFILTIIFEFGFGHYIMKHSWEKLFHDYRIDKGRLWTLVLLWIFFAPVLIYTYF